MKTQLFFLTALLLLLFQSCSYSTRTLQVPEKNSIPIKLGSNTIELYKYQSSALNDLLFVNVHEDEQTSIEALRFFALENRINYLYLHHEETRRIFFELNDSTYNIDPNRMFTDEGRKKTLEAGGSWSPAAQDAVKEFSESLLKALKPSKVVVALHNNTPDNYSIQSYLPDSSEAQNTAQLYINPEMDPDDFIYTTESAFFSYFKSQKINVILQDNSRFVDDGSLSVYCGIHKIPYVNIETEHGHLEAQLRLLHMLHTSDVKP